MTEDYEDYEDYARRRPRWSAWKARNADWYEPVLALLVFLLLGGIAVAVLWGLAQALKAVLA